MQTISIYDWNSLHYNPPFLVCEDELNHMKKGSVLDVTGDFTKDKEIPVYSAPDSKFEHLDKITHCAQRKQNGGAFIIWGAVKESTTKHLT